SGAFGGLVRMALLTGQRVGKLARMKWQDVKDGVWCIRTEAREKGNAGDLVLPKEALAILDELPRFVSCPYVFTNGRVPITDAAKIKELRSDGATVPEIMRRIKLSKASIYRALSA